MGQGESHLSLSSAGTGHSLVTTTIHSEKVELFHIKYIHYS